MCVFVKQRRLMCAAKKAIGKMPLRTLCSGDEVSINTCVNIIIHMKLLPPC